MTALSAHREVKIIFSFTLQGIQVKQINQDELQQMISLHVIIFIFDKILNFKLP